MYEVWEGIRTALELGAYPKNITFLQMALRTIVIYAAGLAASRLAGDRRFGGRYTVYIILSQRPVLLTGVYIGLNLVPSMSLVGMGLVSGD